MILERRRRSVNASADKVYSIIAKMGGERGWLALIGPGSCVAGSTECLGAWACVGAREVVCASARLWIFGVSRPLKPEDQFAFVPR